MWGLGPFWKVQTCTWDLVGPLQRFLLDTIEIRPRPQDQSSKPKLPWITTSPVSFLRAISPVSALTLHTGGWLVHAAI